jgi:hypothetical protein
VRHAALTRAVRRFGAMAALPVSAPAAAGALKLPALRDELASRLETGRYLSLHRCRELSEQARKRWCSGVAATLSLPPRCLPAAHASCAR